MEDVEAAKHRAGESAAATVDDGMVVGLGTGSTAATAIKELGNRVDAGLDIVGVPTSYQARRRAAEAGIPLTDLDDRSQIDVTIDGADQVAGGDAIKGGGAAHTMEKIVAGAADRVVLVVDDRKLSPILDAAVPVAVIPEARSTVATRLQEIGGMPELRLAERKDGPVVTDNGHLVLDCSFGELEDPGSVAKSVAQLPGVVEHGLFVGMADELHVGSPDEVSVRSL